MNGGFHYSQYTEGAGPGGTIGDLVDGTILSVDCTNFQVIVEVSSPSCCGGNKMTITFTEA